MCACMSMFGGGEGGVMVQRERREKECLFLIATGAAAQAQRCIITYLTVLHNHRPSLINTRY